MLAKDVVFNHLREGNHVSWGHRRWWAHMNEDGTLWSSCGDANCCDWDYKDFEEFWEMCGDEEDLRLE